MAARQNMNVLLENEAKPWRLPEERLRNGSSGLRASSAEEDRRGRGFWGGGFRGEGNKKTRGGAKVGESPAGRQGHRPGDPRREPAPFRAEGRRTWDRVSRSP